MDLSRIIAELQTERENLDEAIASLERLQAGMGPRRGRPPAWLKEARDRADSDTRIQDEPSARVSRAGG